MSRTCGTCVYYAPDDFMPGQGECYPFNGMAVPASFSCAAWKSDDSAPSSRQSSSDVPAELLALVPSDHAAWGWDWPNTAVVADYIETLQERLAAEVTRAHLQPILDRLSTIELTPAGVTVAPGMAMTKARDLYRWLMGWDGNTAERGES